VLQKNIYQEDDVYLGVFERFHCICLYNNKNIHNMDKSKQLQKKGNQTAFIIGMVLILILVLLMMYI